MVSELECPSWEFEDFQICGLHWSFHSPVVLAGQHSLEVGKQTPISSVSSPEYFR